MKTTILTLLFFFYVGICSAQSLWINDPQAWRGGQGTIEETQITYEPQGLFMKVDWEITFSARDIKEFSEKDTVEVVYNFRLPQGAVVTDSWLWFGDSILKAMIMDRWSASQVYENIVNRRKDPSLLTKNWNGNYELRIFPMAAKESRKVKITFLTPAKWTQNSVKSFFLSNNLMVSKNPIEIIDVYARLSSNWKNPLIPGEKPIFIAPEINEELGTSHYRKFHFKELEREQEFEVQSPLNDGFYLSYFENAGQQFYQLAVNPGEGMDLRKPQKILLLIDYHRENSELSQPGLINHLKTQLTDLLNEKDSFNILYYDFELKKLNNSWIPGDSATIVQSIDGLSHEPFPSYSNLPSLLASGIKYAKTQAESKFILIANSDNVDDVEPANTLIEDLMKLMDPVFPIYITDFQTKNFRYNWIKNFNYRGNEYFYRNLVKLTGGDYCNTFDGNTFSECFYTIYQRATNEAGYMDIHTTLDNGFCFGRYVKSDLSGNLLNSIYLETGRFSGDFPFEINISGLFDNEIFTKKIQVKKGDAIESDSLTGIFWYGNEILEMEQANNNYSIINDIVDKSIENRILSNYTAFLCLEPGMMGELENIEESQVINRGWEILDDVAQPVSAKVTEVLKTEISAYPNPFKKMVNVEINFSEEIITENVILEIYDLFGKRITFFNIEEFNGEKVFTVEWDATDIAGNPVPKGTYLFICTTPEGRLSKKLVLM